MLVGDGMTAALFGDERVRRSSIPRDDSWELLRADAERGISGAELADRARLLKIRDGAK